MEIHRLDENFSLWWKLGIQQGRVWENWLEKYIIVKVNLRVEKYNWLPQKIYFGHFYQKNEGDELRQALPAEYNLLGLIAIFLVGLNYWVIE